MRERATKIRRGSRRCATGTCRSNNVRDSDGRRESARAPSSPAACPRIEGRLQHLSLVAGVGARSRAFSGRTSAVDGTAFRRCRAISRSSGLLFVQVMSCVRWATMSESRLGIEPRTRKDESRRRAACRRRRGIRHRWAKVDIEDSRWRTGSIHPAARAPGTVRSVHHCPRGPADRCTRPANDALQAGEREVRGDVSNRPRLPRSLVSSVLDAVLRGEPRGNLRRCRTSGFHVHPRVQCA